MENVGATWEQIVALARVLDFRTGRSAEPEDSIVLAKLVLDFHRNVVGQHLKRAEPTRKCEPVAERERDEAEASSGAVSGRKQGVAA
jgi:hypothetical protein